MSNDRPPLSSEPPPDASSIDIESGVGMMSRLGYVQLRWGQQSGQLTTREARLHALSILDAAAAADHDAAVLRWLVDTMGLPIERASAVLVDLRKARRAVDQEGGNA